MAIIDSKLEFSDAQSLVASASAVTVSTNVVDFSTLKDGWGAAITPDIGEGGDLEFNVLIDTAIAVAGSSGTVSITLVSKAGDASISSGATTHVTISAAEAAAAGTKYHAYVPAGTINRYVGVLYTGSGAVTAGNANAFVNLDHETAV